MSATALAPRDALAASEHSFGAQTDAPPTRRPCAADGLTLEDLVARTWDALVAGGATDCVSCGAALRPRWSAGAGVVAGHCPRCGSELR